MIKRTRTTTLCAMALSTLLLSGCGGGSNPSGDAGVTGAQTSSVAIDFSALLDGGELLCSENNLSKVYNNVGTSNESVTVTDFRFFVSEVNMVKADGTRVPMTLDNNDYQYQAENGDHVALLDFEDNTGNCVDRGNTPETYKTVVGSVEEGEYTGLEFTLGVPFDINHDKDSYVDVVALNHPKMNWNWQAGRKFTKMEVKSESNPSLIWNFHLGSTGCEANSDENSTIKASSCAQPNRVKVVLENFDPEINAVAVDYTQLVTQNDVSIDLGGASGCMSALTDPECQDLLPQLALDVDSQNGLCINDNDCSTQQLFYTISK